MYLVKQGRIEVKWNPEHVNLAKQAMSEVLNVPLSVIDENQFIEVDRVTSSHINKRYAELVEEAYPTEVTEQQPTIGEQILFETQYQTAVLEILSLGGM